MNRYGVGIRHLLLNLQYAFISTIALIMYIMNIAQIELFLCSFIIHFLKKYGYGMSIRISIMIRSNDAAIIFENTYLDFLSCNIFV